ncbi:NADP-dependent oxidoreductase [Variovorax paradoxus]|jgi:NADPH-dependent curcumin reductase CurA|uniref:NADP-dependent oxidoreductase n=1 Tax=Variovorax TaxID=34072 RepID=UPI0006E5134F|nr:MULTISPECIES: NADP-dependent oxidoreductase [unclassified Variovorax]KPU91058.1 NADP-dependent oxidoreductase [Variovorax paradoxus]KPU98826.1 NADP-dependent oxidoreductase [Variovorax paradoxus]KPV05285.1 NADP-dependent oxidoreductase [Variovorax paradoxus]KPV15860.1 NADP-dependent oxidoreductase [Variovorax paradoxus]KPV24580.1 NADP-dependent oxidoreductase [Variovorax paradoxus]
MTDTTALVNHQVRLAKRPEGAATREHWSFGSEPVAQPAEGGVLVKTLSLSLDPAMRGWLNDAKSYIPPVEIGAVMRAGGIGRVIASKNPQFAVGDTVYGTLNVQEYMLIPQEEIKRNGLVKIDLRVGSITQWLNVLGMPGMTGYFGLMDVGQPKAGETVVISGAAGAVGQTVGQLAKIKGCRVVGIAGGEAKCDWVVKELGFDACIDYKAGAAAVRDGLKQHCPKGVDIYFDNVGGEILDLVLARIARKARIIICGAISQYNNANSMPAAGPRNYLSLLVNRARMEGIVVFDYADRYPVAIAELAGYLKDGRMKSKEDIVQGLDTFPEALNRLFSGANFGKLVLQVATE